MKDLIDALISRFDAIMLRLYGSILAFFMLCVSVLTVLAVILIFYFVVFVHMPERKDINMYLLGDFAVWLIAMFVTTLLLIRSPLTPRTFLFTAFFAIGSFVGIFAAAYRSCGLHYSDCNPDGTTCVTATSHNGYDALYFSAITLSTVGYGDFTPANAPARLFAAIEALSGYFLLALLVFAMTKVVSVKVNE